MIRSATMAWAAAGALWLCAPTRAEESPAERRERIEKLAPAEKKELLEHQQRFLKLDPTEQDRLRRLSRELEDDQQGPELRRIMQRYSDWLKTLPSYQRAQLLELTPEQRVKRIQELQAEQARRASRGAAWGELARREWRLSEKPGAAGKPPSRLDPADMEGLFAWMEDYAKKHAGQMLEKLPAQRERVKKGLDRETDPVRRQELIGWIWLWWQIDNRGTLPSLSDQELADLRSRLSPKTRKQLEAISPDQQRRLVSGLFTSFMLQQYAARHTGLPLNWAADEELGRFFERELSAEQRDKLATLSGEDMQRTLWRMYISWKLRQLPPGRGGKDKRPGAGAARSGDSSGSRSAESYDALPRGWRKSLLPADKPPSSRSDSGSKASEESATKKAKEKPQAPARDFKKTSAPDASD
jgi:hypothetical protein